MELLHRLGGPARERYPFRGGELAQQPHRQQRMDELIPVSNRAAALDKTRRHRGMELMEQVTARHLGYGLHRRQREPRPEDGGFLQQLTPLRPESVSPPGDTAY